MLTQADLYALIAAFEQHIEGATTITNACSMLALSCDSGRMPPADFVQGAGGLEQSLKQLEAARGHLARIKAQIPRL
jgi:hypothetical protein